MERFGVGGDAVSVGRVPEVLASAYGLVVDRVSRIPIGEGTVNVRARSVGGRELFVKVYPAGVDLGAERAAIGLSAVAGRAGVPVAVPVPDRDGHLLTVASGNAVSVWGWVPGRTLAADPTPARYQAAGAALGRLHAALAGLPASSGPAPQVEQWRHPDVAALRLRIDGLLAESADRIDRGLGDPFDVTAAETLTERRESLHHVPRLLADLPELSAQVLHGDYSAPNLLFDGDRLAAVVDFTPPDPFLVSYELGRIAFTPDTVTGDLDWEDTALAVVAAYVGTNPAVSPVDVRACARVTAVHLLASLYGVEDHYRTPGRFQDDLDRFWVRRHRTVAALLARLPVLEERLHELVP